MMRLHSALKLARFAFASVWLAAFWSAAALAAEPSAKLKTLQDSVAQLGRAGANREALPKSQDALALTVQEFGPDSEQAGIQSYEVAALAEAVGDFALAERQYRESVRIFEIVYGPENAEASLPLENLGNVLLKAGRPPEAESVFERVLKIRKDVLGDHAFTAGAYAGLGETRLARGDAAGALPYYRKAVTLLTTQNTAQAVVKSIVETDIKRHRDVFIGLARAASGLRQQAGADGSALADETYAAGQLAWATSAASALAKMTARLRAGDTELGRSIRGLDALSNRIVALNEEDMKALAAWYSVQKSDPAYSKLLDAFHTASIDKSRVNAPVAKRQKQLVEELQNLLARCPPGDAKSGCKESNTRVQAIGSELGALSAEASKGTSSLLDINRRMQAAEQALPGYADFSTRRAARLAESQRLEQQLAADRAAVVAKFPDYLSLAEPRPLSIADTQGLLGAAEALVSILTGPTRSFVWAVTRERADWAEIEAGETQLAADVSALRRGLDPAALTDDAPPAAGAATVTRGFDLERAHRLHQLLLARFAPMLAGKRHLLLVPTGALTSLPFQVLLTDAPRPGLSERDSLRTAPWLIRRHALSVLPSVQSLSSLRKFAANGTAVKPFFGIGDPVLVGPDSVKPQKRGAGPALPQPAALYRDGLADVRALRELMPLPETAMELQAVARTLRAPSDAISIGAAATETRVKTAPLSDYHIIHFATHGLVAGDLDGVNEPALVLTPPPVPTETDDGLLTASEIATLKLDADWVVLSACNTAAGDKVGADALSGLARAFFFAGARALVSHWSVYSQAAVQLTTRTFANLAADRRLGRAEAFRRAMLSVIDEGMPPSYWAPFVVVGEGGTTAVAKAASR
jgi:CHAT domain-containing protein/tetratricopeptide (TPR) repeat protein